MAYKKAFCVADFGMCFLEDLVNEVKDNKELVVEAEKDVIKLYRKGKSDRNFVDDFSSNFVFLSLKNEPIWKFMQQEISKKMSSTCFEFYRISVSLFKSLFRLTSETQICCFFPIVFIIFSRFEVITSVINAKFKLTDFLV